jgi:hypothetical protein
MFKALPVGVWRMIWKQYHTSVVLKELLAKTMSATIAGYVSNGVSYVPLNCPSSIRFRWQCAKAKRAREMSTQERFHEMKLSGEAQRARNREIAKRDFDDWFALTGSDVRMSKRKKVTL